MSTTLETLAQGEVFMTDGKDEDMTMRKSTIAFLAMLVLAACGDTTGEQTVIGAGAGAATAVVLNGNVAAGALIGAGANVLASCNQKGNC